MFTAIELAIQEAQTGSVEIRGHQVEVRLVPAKSVLALRSQIPEPESKAVRVGAKVERDPSHPTNVEARAMCYSLRAAAQAGIAVGIQVDSRVLSPSDDSQFASRYAESVMESLGPGEIQDINAEVERIDTGKYVPDARSAEGNSASEAGETSDES